MGKGPCFKCSGPHFAADCPEIKFAAELGTASDGRPPWCGECDQRTRLLYDGDQARRCPRCNPNEDLPPQFKICGCGNAIYRWDKAECGQHQPVGKQTQTTGAK